MQKSIQIDDTVFIWRSDGAIRGSGGIVAKGLIVDTPKPMNDDAVELWKTNEGKVTLNRVKVHLEDVRLTPEEGMLLKANLENDSELSNLWILKWRSSILYKVLPKHSLLIEKLWKAFYVQIQPKSWSTGTVESIEKDRKKWTREQTIVAFNLYCKIPFNLVSSRHPEIIKVAGIIGRSVNSLKMKIGNFGSFDPELKKRGIVGLSNTSKLDEQIWKEFNNNWEELAFESEQIASNFEGKTISDSLDIKLVSEIPEGIDRERLIKTRVNQSFFRQAVLSAYNYSCCITGIDIPELLIASHIVPWSKNKKDRLNPRNGLCLNALHDRAYDVGILTIMPDFKIKVSKRAIVKSHPSIENWILSFDGKKIRTPERFVPSTEFLEYHNKEVFLS